MLLITQRKIVKELYKLRWKSRIGKEKEGLKFTYNDYKAKTKGIEWRELRKELEQKEFYRRPINLPKLIHKNSENFLYRIDDIITQCIDEGYIKKTTDNFLIVTSKGEKFISFWHQISTFLKHPFVLKVIEIGLPTVGITKVLLSLIEKL